MSRTSAARPPRVERGKHCGWCCKALPKGMPATTRWHPGCQPSAARKLSQALAKLRASKHALFRQWLDRFEQQGVPRREAIRSARGMTEDGEQCDEYGLLPGRARCRVLDPKTGIECGQPRANHSTATSCGSSTCRSRRSRAQRKKRKKRQRISTNNKEIRDHMTKKKPSKKKRPTKTRSRAIAAHITNMSPRSAAVANILADALEKSGEFRVQR